MTMLITMMLQSCAVMFGGSKYNASINTDPEAEIYINGFKEGKGNTTVLVPRNQNLEVNLKKEGYEDVRRVYPNKLRGGTLVLTIISWFIVGLAVDFGTGAIYKPDTATRGVVQNDGKNFVYEVEFDGERK